MCSSLNCGARVRCRICWHCDIHCACSPTSHCLGTTIWGTIFSNAGETNPLGLSPIRPKNSSGGEWRVVSIKGRLYVASDSDASIGIVRSSQLPLFHYSVNTVANIRQKLSPREKELVSLLSDEIRLGRLVITDMSGRRILHSASAGPHSVSVVLDSAFPVAYLDGFLPAEAEVSIKNELGELSHPGSTDVSKAKYIEAVRNGCLLVSASRSDIELPSNVRWASRSLSEMACPRNYSSSSKTSFGSWATIVQVGADKELQVAICDYDLNRKDWEFLVIDPLIVSAYEGGRKDKHYAGLDPGSAFMSGTRSSYDECGWIVIDKAEIRDVKSNSSPGDGSMAWVLHPRMEVRARNIIRRATAPKQKLGKGMNVDDIASQTLMNRNDVLVAIDSPAGPIHTNGVSGCYLPLAVTSQAGGFPLGSLSVGEVMGVTLHLSAAGELTSRKGDLLKIDKIGGQVHISLSEGDGEESFKLDLEDEVNGSRLEVMLSDISASGSELMEFSDIARHVSGYEEGIILAASKILGEGLTDQFSLNLGDAITLASSMLSTVWYEHNRLAIVSMEIYIGEAEIGARKPGLEAPMGKRSFGGPDSVYCQDCLTALEGPVVVKVDSGYEAQGEDEVSSFVGASRI